MATFSGSQGARGLSNMAVKIPLVAAALTRRRSCLASGMGRSNPFACMSVRTNVPASLLRARLEACLASAGPRAHRVRTNNPIGAPGRTFARLQHPNRP